MDQVFFQFFSKEITGSHIAMAAGSFLLLVAIKIYSSGGVCKINKDLSGKLAIVAGGNAGIGKDTAFELARKNCDIIIGARDRGKLQETIKQINLINPKVKAVYSILDLGDKQSIKQFSEFVHDNCQKIDFLINNAGVSMVPDRTETKDGFQMHMGINHFGHFYLTYLLFPLLKKSEFFRITNVSSRGHLRVKQLNFEDLNYKNGYNRIQAYQASKLSNVYFTRILQKKIDQAKLKGITTSLHPGLVRTEITRYVSGVLRAVFYVIYPLWYLISKNSKQGAQTTLYTVLEDPQKLVPGEYYADCKVSQSTDTSKNLDNAQKLWKISEQTWGIKFNL